MEDAGALQLCFQKLKQLEEDGVASITIEGGVMRYAGSRKVCYDSCEASNLAVLEPFPDGYPLLPSVKALYVDVSGTGRVEVVVTYAFLDAASRRLLSGFTDGDEDKGVKVRHRDGTMYQVVGLLSPGHSPNYLAPL